MKREFAFRTLWGYGPLLDRSASVVASILKLCDVETLCGWREHTVCYDGTALRRLRSAVETWGMNPPILTNQEGKVLAGFGRIRAARELGLTRVACLLIENMNEAELHDYFLAQHALAIRAIWSEALFESELKGLLKLPS